MNLGGFIILLILIIIPLGIIWALNTLFGLRINYSLETWAAVFILLLAVNSKTSIK
jgi:formate hydrogenlyase subunit 4